MTSNKPDRAASSVTVRLTGSGTEFQVAQNESVLAAALRQGVVLPYSCRSGTCSSCKGRVISGQYELGEYQPAALSETERAGGFALLCQTHALSDLEIEARELTASSAIEIKQLPCRVSSMQLLCHDVMLVRLALPRNQSFHYLAGQYIDILTRDGQRRSFSMASPAAQGEDLELHIRLVPDGRFTSHVFSGMKERDLLRMNGPLGTFFLREGQGPALLVAGGTGFAPIKAIVEQALDEGDKRPMHLFWGVRSAPDLYMRDLVEGWCRQSPGFQFTPVLSEPRTADNWTGAVGLVHETVVQTYPDLADYQVYASGPPPMIEAVRESFDAHGLSAENLFFDSFEFAHGAAGVTDP